MRKNELRQLLNKDFDQVIHFVRKQKDSDFSLSSSEGKWSVGQNLDHLRKSTKVINKLMSIPKIVHWFKFGKVKELKYDYETLKKAYKEKTLNGAKAPKSYHPREISNEDKTLLLEKFDKERNKLIEYLMQASDSYLNRYAVTHPLLGKMSMKEILYFTSIHTQHHLDTMKKYY